MSLTEVAFHFLFYVRLVPLQGSANFFFIGYDDSMGDGVERRKSKGGDQDD